MKKFISWRRVSTKMQGRSGLGLEAQLDIVRYWANEEGGEIIADYMEVYTGTDLSGCRELRKAISHCKEIGATLIIAKTDRFRNDAEAISIYNEMGKNIYFCDCPSQDEFMIKLMFLLAAREAKLISIRTKQALQAKISRGETLGRPKGCAANTAANEASAKSRREAALANPHNQRFVAYVRLYESRAGRITPKTDITPLTQELSALGYKTATGLDFTNNQRTRAMLATVRRIFAA